VVFLAGLPQGLPNWPEYLDFAALPQALRNS
jgi:hypothetical protein